MCCKPPSRSRSPSTWTRSSGRQTVVQHPNPGAICHPDAPSPYHHECNETKGNLRVTDVDFSLRETVTSWHHCEMDEQCQQPDEGGHREKDRSRIVPLAGRRLRGAARVALP